MHIIIRISLFINIRISPCNKRISKCGFLNWINDLHRRVITFRTRQSCHKKAYKKQLYPSNYIFQFYCTHSFLIYLFLLEDFPLVLRVLRKIWIQIDIPLRNWIILVFSYYKILKFWISGTQSWTQISPAF